MLLNARQSFVRTVLIAAAVLLLALSIQGAVLFDQTTSAGLSPSSHVWVAPDSTDAPASAIACVPGDPSQGGGTGC
jgi:hypothetical protein